MYIYVRTCTIFYYSLVHTRPRAPDKVETMIKSNPSLTLKDVSISSEAEDTLFRL